MSRKDQMTKDDLNQAIIATFNAMEEHAEYVLNQETYVEWSNVRKEYGYSAVKKEDYRLKRIGQILHGSGDAGRSYFVVLDFAKSPPNLAFALSFAFTFALALSFGGFEKLAQTCEGKVVEIDGKKYRLTSV